MWGGRENRDMSNEDMAAKDELIRQAQVQAETLEKPTADGVCLHHADLAKGTALALRLLVGLYGRRDHRSPLTLLAGIGVPTPLCVLLWAIGTSKGWW